MSEVLTRPVGAILVGGSSRRMGEDKARVMLGTTTMFDHVARALEAAGCEVIAIGRPPGDFDVPTYPDDDPAGAGPASGLETAADRRRQTRGSRGDRPAVPLTTNRR